MNDSLNTSSTAALELSLRKRTENLDRMRDEVFDLAIIGGGVTGAGVPRDAASRATPAPVTPPPMMARSNTSSRIRSRFSVRLRSDNSSAAVELVLRLSFIGWRDHSIRPVKKSNRTIRVNPFKSASSAVLLYERTEIDQG